MKNSNLLKLLLLTCTIFSATVFAADPAEGYWYTIDDEDNKKSSIVKLQEKNGKLVGTIVKILNPKDRGELCQDCPDQFKDQPIEGLQFMWDLKKEGTGEWRSGRILDPKNGSIYKSKLDVDGDKLTVRGYIGISLLGRSQTWEKVKPQPKSDPK